MDYARMSEPITVEAVCVLHCKQFDVIPPQEYFDVIS